MIDYILNECRKTSIEASGQLTLGKLIEELTMVKQEVPDAKVYFDFCGFFPTDIDSWLGIYAELALSYKKDGEPMSIDEFIALLKKTIGQTFVSFEGCSHTMKADTPIWVANKMEAGKTAVVGITDDGVNVYIRTDFVDPYDW